MDFTDLFGTNSYSLGSPGANSVASGVDVYAQSLGFSPELSGMMGATAGNYASSQLGTLPSTSSSLGGGSGGLDPSVIGSFQNGQFVPNMNNPIQQGQVGSGSSVTSALGKAGSWFTNLTFAGVASALVGIGLIVGSIYLFGSASLSDAIGNAVKGK